MVVESRQALLRAADGTPEAILEVNRDVTPRRELVAALARLQTLQAISEAAFAQLALPALLRQVLERITAALAVDNTAILLLDEAGETLIVHEAVGPEEVQTGQMRVPVGQGVAGRIAATRQPLIVADLRAAEPVNPLLREQMAVAAGGAAAGGGPPDRRACMWTPPPRASSPRTSCTCSSSWPTAWRSPWTMRACIEAERVAAGGA